MKQSKKAIYLLVTIIISGFVVAVGQAQNISAAFYNVQNLFDTIDSPLVRDYNFTPKGRYGWNSHRYNSKIRSVARVIDDLRVDIIALAEIENQDVVEDLVRATTADYAYFHHNSSDSRGIDIAILYRPERFFVDSIQVYKIKNHPRQIITMFGTVAQRNVVFSACHLPSSFSLSNKRTRIALRVADYFGGLAENNAQSVCLFAGDFNFNLESNHMKNILESSPMLVQSRTMSEYLGTYQYKNNRFSFDHILVNKAIENTSYSYIFIKDYLLEHSIGEQTTIKPSYRKGVYMAGTSDHLPIVVIVEN